MNQSKSDATEAKFLINLLVPSEHLCYADHFPGDPLVPGALLLNWIGIAVEKKIAHSIVYYKQIKFLSPVRPGDLLNIHVIEKSNSAQFLLDVFVANSTTTPEQCNDKLVIKGIFETGTFSDLDLTEPLTFSSVISNDK